MKNLPHYLDLVLVLTQKEIKVRYKNSLLGYLWSIANPLAFAFVYFVAFKVVIRVKIENYPVFLISGLFAWQCFANSVGASPAAFLGNASIIKKIQFPRSIITLAVVLQDMFHFVLSLPVIVLFLLIFRQRPSLSWLYGVPLLLAAQLLMTYGIALAISTVNLFFRDMERLTVVLLTFAFYFTPVLYTADMVPEQYRPLIALNPVAPLMINWRGMLLHGTMDPGYLALSFAYGALFCIVGHAIYRKLSWRFAEVL